MSSSQPQEEGRSADAVEYVPGLTAQIPTYDLNVERFEPFIAPRAVKQQLPLTSRAHRTVVKSREAVKRVLSGRETRTLVVVGPCSIHDENAALEYAERLRRLGEDVGDVLYLIMRVYFEKPRTTVGWKGLINDPHLDGTFDMEEGIRRARRILREITEMGLPAATEFLDPIVPQYLADLVTWCAIGARTTESQTHRQMASGLSMPVGFKNATGGDVQVAIDAMRATRHRHSFLGINDDGQTAVIRTLGNPWSHLILRGGPSRPNYDADAVAEAERRLGEVGLPSSVMIDCSHDNSGKKFKNQPAAYQSVIEQRAAGTGNLIGLMLESNLHEGNQPFPCDPDQLRYGVSITDECLGWEQTERMLREGARRLRAGR